MIVDFNAKYPEIALCNARHFLNLIGYIPDTSFLKLHYRIFEPFNDAYSFDQEYSVTDNSSLEDRIRYWLNARFIRSIIYTAKFSIDNKNVDEIHIYNSSQIDPESNIFFQYLHKIHNIKIHLHLDKMDGKSDIPLCLEEKEIRLLKHTQEVPHENANHFSRHSQILMALGITRPVIELNKAILYSLEKKHKDPKLLKNCFRYLATSHIMEGNSYMGQFFSERWIDVTSGHDQISAMYSLALTYLRHHPKYFRNHDKGKELLDEAFKRLNEDPGIQSSENLQFIRVFVMNGFALSLFRENKIQEVLDLMDWGIKQLNYLENSAKVIIHKCVLMYNIALCCIKQHRYEDAIKELHKLIEFDPNYTDYHLELAKMYIDMNQLDQAEIELEKIYQLNPILHEYHALKGYLFIKKSDYNNALDSFKLANMYCYNKPLYQYDLLESMFELKQYQSVVDYVSNISFYGKNLAEFEDILAIEAESQYHLKQYDKVDPIFKKDEHRKFTSRKTEENSKIFHKITNNAFLT